MDRFHIVDRILLFGVGAEHTSGREESPCGAALRAEDGLAYTLVLEG